MKNNDWRDALGALLPDDYVPEAPAEDNSSRTKPILTVTVDRKRAGKTATIISGFDPDDQAATELAAQLKRSLGVGGSARGGEILIQGDRATQVCDRLKALGYKVVSC